MTEVDQVRDDLRFVRQAVVRQRRPNQREARLAYGYWALYVLIGYTLIDLAPRWAGWFFMLGGFGGALLMRKLNERFARQIGEQDAAEKRRSALHWAGGILLVLAATFGLATVVPALRGTAGSQVLVVMIGVVYYFWGVYVDRNFLWLGPLLVIGGIGVRFIPHLPWTGLGVVIAVGLVLPTLLPPRRQRLRAVDSDDPTSTGSTTP